MTSKKRGRRPAYREGKEEKSVKVYTINHESRYILVKEVPKISNIKDEVLKLFSLYGTIQEYRILDSHPDVKDQFSQVFWIKYTHIQAARVAKRKMNNHSFFGVFLKVTYGPEYEEVDDTRQKLIERRKAVARRLRQLEMTRQDRNHQQVSYPASTLEDQTTQHVENQNPHSEAINQPGTSHQSLHPSERGLTSFDGSESSWQKFPALPPPPSHLPPAEWSHPTSEPDETIPRVPSTHATLPKGFDPFSEGENASGTSTTSSLCKNGEKSEAQRRMLNHFGTHSSVGSVKFSHSLQTPESEVPSTSPWCYGGKKDISSARSNPQPKQSILRGARPKLVPRKRFAWNDKQLLANADTSNHFLGQRLNPPPSPAHNPSNIQGSEAVSGEDAVGLRRLGLKRRATSPLEEGPSTSRSSAAETGPTSFDQSVLNIREKMIQISKIAPHHQVQSSSTEIPRQGSTQVTQVSSMLALPLHQQNNGAPSASVSVPNNRVSSADTSQRSNGIPSASVHGPNDRMPGGQSHPISLRGPSSTERRRI